MVHFTLALFETDTLDITGNYRDIGFSLSYTHRQSTPVDIAHFARGFYSTPGSVFYVFPKISFLENSHFLVSLTTQHAVPVGTQYRLVLCSAPPCPASVVVL